MSSDLVVHVLVADDSGVLSSLDVEGPLAGEIAALSQNSELQTAVQRVLATRLPARIKLTAKEPTPALVFFDVWIKPRIGDKGRVTGAALIVTEVPPSAQPGGLAEQISELESINKSLTTGLGEESAMVVAQRRFLAVMSHEIRTPLNAVVASAELLGTSALDGMQTECLQTIDAGSRVMLRMLNDVLDYASLEAGTLKLDDLPFNVHHMFEECSALAKRYCQIRGNKYSVTVEETVPQLVRGDGVRLRQVMLNLLNNASVKRWKRTKQPFTRDGEVHVVAKCRDIDGDDAKKDETAESKSKGDVKKGGQQQPQQKKPQEGQQGAPAQDEEAVCGKDEAGRALKLVIRCEVADTGIGMSPEILRRIFEPFMQADQSARREFGGCGLGLAIVHRLLVLMKGKIEVHSKVGFGTLIRFEVPLIRAAPDAHPVKLPPIPPINVSLLDISDATPPSAILELGAVQVADRVPTEEEDTSFYQGMRTTTRVLVADDSAVNQKIMVKVLEHFGWKADVCSNGLEAVKLLSANFDRYGILFLDAHMPVLDGMSALKELRAAEKSETSRRFVAVVTAEAMTGSEMKFMNLGFDAYISKPITLHSVNLTLRAATSALSRWRGVWRSAGGIGSSKRAATPVSVASASASSGGDSKAPGQSSPSTSASSS